MRAERQCYSCTGVRQVAAMPRLHLQHLGCTMGVQDMRHRLLLMCLSLEYLQAANIQHPVGQ